MEANPSWFEEAMLASNVHVPKPQEGCFNNTYSEVLEHGTLPFTQWLFPTDQEWMLQDRMLIATLLVWSIFWLGDLAVKYFPWAEQFPAMNCIINRGKILSKPIKKIKPTSKNEMESVLKPKQSKFNPEFCKNACFPGVVWAKTVVKAKRWPKKQRKSENYSSMRYNCIWDD